MDMDPSHKYLQFDQACYEQIGKDFGKALFIMFEGYIKGKKIKRKLSSEDFYSISGDDK
jgi:hypothetical protein